MANHASLIRFENEGKPVVRRGRRFIEFDLGNGVTRHVATIDPLHKRDSETEIDATWYPVTEQAYQWEIGANDWQAHARSVFNVGSLIEWVHASGEWVVVDPQSINWVNQDYSRQQIAIKQAVTGTASDCTLTFSNAYGSGKHFSYTAHPRRLIKHFTIDNLSDLPEPEPWLTGTLWLEVEWTIENSSGVELWLDGVKWARKNKVKTQTSNLIEFRSVATGEVLWWADAPVATDADGETSAAQYEVEATGGVYFIRVRVPREWMVAAAYPVAIDPTFTDGYGGDVDTAKDNYLSEAATTTNYGTGTALFTGKTTTTIRRTLIEFDLSSIDGGATCNSAILYLTWLANGGRAVTVYELRSGRDGWTEAGSTWNTYDGANNWTTAGCGSTVTDYDNTGIGGITTRTNEGTDDISLTTSAVEDWFGASNENYGLIILDDSETDYYRSNWASSDNETTGYRPKLVVDYTAESAPSPNVSSSITVSEDKSVTVGTSQVSPSDTISLTDTPTARPQIDASASDSIEVSDSASASIPINASASETITVTDTPASTVGSPAVSTSDTVSITDSPAASVGSPQVDVSDTVSVTDQPSAEVLEAGQINLSASDSISVSEDVSSQTSSSQVTVSDSISITDTPAALVVEFEALSIAITPDNVFATGIRIYTP